MNTSIKLNNDFLKLLDITRKIDPNYEGTPIIRVYCKNNILYTTNEVIAFKCDLKQEQLPVSDLQDGYYEVSGKYLVMDKETTGIFPDVESVKDIDFTTCFQVNVEKPYLSMIHTLSHSGYFLNYIKYEKQLKQIFKGTEHTIFIADNDRMSLIEFSYPTYTIGSVAVAAEVSLFIMPMKYNLPEIKEINYNPSKNERPFKSVNANLI